MVASGTVGLTTGATAFTTSNANVFTPASYVMRLLVGEDSVLGNTAVRIVSYQNNAGALDAIWIGDNLAAADYKMVAYEYVLPATVKDITSVRFQDDEITLQQIGRDEGFHSAIPRPTQEITDNPSLVVVGSTVADTILTGGTATPGLGLLIWPCPLTRYRLEYSYTYRHPQVSASQALENVSDAAIHEIVGFAYSFFESSSGRDPELGAANQRMHELRMAKHNAMDQADPLRHRTLRSRDEVTGPISGSRPADPDIFEP
jgi:hypothetical protein